MAELSRIVLNQNLSLYARIPVHDREANDEPAAPGQSTDVFQIRQAIGDRTLTFRRLLAAYDHPLDIDTEAISARMDDRERARRTRRGGRACASTGYSRLVMGGLCGSPTMRHLRRAFV